MKRKVIQIAVSDGIYALCDDGTLWWCAVINEDWIKLRDVPQWKRQPVKRYVWKDTGKPI